MHKIRVGMDQYDKKNCETGVLIHSVQLCMLNLNQNGLIFDLCTSEVKSKEICESSTC